MPQEYFRPAGERREDVYWLRADRPLRAEQLGIPERAPGRPSRLAQDGLLEPPQLPARLRAELLVPGSSAPTGRPRARPPACRAAASISGACLATPFR